MYKNILWGILLVVTEVRSQTPAQGPYYFVSDNTGGNPQFYWGGKDSYGGVRVIENYNLLAAVLGDSPPATPRKGQQLVSVETFDFGSGTVTLQPFAYKEIGSAKKHNLPIGNALRNFLNDPLGGAKFDLSLPFRSTDVALSDRSALLRVDDSPKGWHTSIDFDANSSTTHVFDVYAPADAVIAGKSQSSGNLALLHTASNGKQFITVYAHLESSSITHLTTNAIIKRGDKIGTIRQERNDNGNPAYSHLHFSVGVKGPAATVNGTAVPEMWYLIDPFGVYDYRRNRSSTVLYNYLPNNNLSFPVKDIRHAYVFRTNPVKGCLQVAGEMEVGESKTVTVSANKTHDLTGIYMRSGQKFQFTTESPAWRNGNTETDCDGYEGSLLDVVRRHNDLRMMALIGEIFEQNNDDNYTGTYFRIGCSRTWTATKTGYLVCFANDNIAFYSDNSGVVTLKVKRTE